MTPLIIISDFLNRPTLILRLGFFLYRLLEPLQEKPDYSPLEVIKHPLPGLLDRCPKQC